MKTPLKLAAALCLALTALSSAQAAPLTVSSEKTVLFITESVTQSGIVNISAETGPLTTSEMGFSIKKLGSKSAPGESPASLPAIVIDGAFGTPTGLPTRGHVLDYANDRVKQSFPFLQQSMSAYMKKYGISSGWFNYKQEVRIDVNGVAETWTLYWDYFSDQNGRGAYADVKLVSPDPKALYVVYTPKAVDKDLPQGWAYAGAGTVKYQLRDMVKFQPVTDWVTIDVNGAFDTLQTETEYLDAGVNCLMDNAKAGCPSTATDVKRLMDQTGAVLTVVDYVRRVEPVWVEQADGTVVPKMSASIDKRELAYPGCANPTYRNVGSIGYTLSSTLGRYLASSSGSPRLVNFQQIQEYRGTYLSPTANYDWSVKVPRRQALGLANLAIDPVKGTSLINTSDIPGLISTAPISIVGNPTPSLGTYKSGIYHFGGGAHDHYIEFNAICGLDGVEIETGFWMRYAKGGGPWGVQWQKFLVPDHTWTHIGIAEHSATRFLAYSDPDSQMVRLVDNAGTTCYPYACRDWYGENHNANALTSINDALYANNGPGSAMPTWACDTASMPYYLASEGNAVLHTQQICSGMPYLRGWYLNGAGPIVEMVLKRKIDPPSTYYCQPLSNEETYYRPNDKSEPVYCYDIQNTGGDG